MTSKHWNRIWLAMGAPILVAAGACGSGPGTPVPAPGESAGADKGGAFGNGGADKVEGATPGMFGSASKPGSASVGPSTSTGSSGSKPGGGGGSGGGGGAGGGSSLPPSGGCVACASDKCKDETVKCNADPKCKQLTACIFSCTGDARAIATCRGNCIKKNPSPAGVAIYSCAYTKCATECASS